MYLNVSITRTNSSSLFPISHCSVVSFPDLLSVSTSKFWITFLIVRTDWSKNRREREREKRKRSWKFWCLKIIRNGPHSNLLIFASYIIVLFDLICLGMFSAQSLSPITKKKSFEPKMSSRNFLSNCAFDYHVPSSFSFFSFTLPRIKFTFGKGDSNKECFWRCAEL